MKPVLCWETFSAAARDYSFKGEDTDAQPEYLAIGPSFADKCKEM